MLFRSAVIGNREIEFVAAVRRARQRDIQYVRRAIELSRSVVDPDRIDWQIAEIEINPLRVNSHGALALDALVVLDDKT